MADLKSALAKIASFGERVNALSDADLRHLAWLVENQTEAGFASLICVASNEKQRDFIRLALVLQTVDEYIK